MPRWTSYEVPVDTGLFSPLGLQPTAVCRLGFNAAGRWLGRHAISHRRLVAEHDTGLVVWSVRLAFEGPVGFFDADFLEMRVGCRVRGAGTQLECRAELDGPLDTKALLQACCVPLELGGDAALSGRPARLGPEVMAAFHPDEVEARPHRSPLPALRAAVVAGGAALACGRTPFQIHRHQCEVADQWFWPEAVSLAAAGREELLQAAAERTPQLLSALRTPVRRLDLLFNRPFFLFDEGEVRSSAHQWEGRLVFIHELAGADDERPRALVAEQFSLPEGGSWD